MCGRYWLQDNPEELARRYGAKAMDIEYLPPGEIFPGSKVPVITGGEKKEVKIYKWGFPAPGRKGNIINARAETINEKYLFKDKYFQTRCLIPANAFFEWKTDGKNKTKYRVNLPDDIIFSMAGIYGLFSDDNGNDYEAFVIITTVPNRLVAPIHSRMPAIITPEKEHFWLDGNTKSNDFLKKVLTDADGGKDLISHAI